jgi:hypothetical protein
MVRGLRSRARPVALALLWSLAALWTLSASPHLIECVDEDGTVAVHDAGGHAIGAVRTSEDPLHCFLCHWIRAFNADGVRAARVTVVDSSAPASFHVPVETPRAVSRLSIVPRAPPA